MDSIAYPGGGHDYSAYVPDHEDCPVTARALQGMARVRSGQAPAWPLVSDRSARRGSGVKHDFACTLTRNFPPVLVVLRAQSCLRLEGRATDTQRAIPGSEPRQGLCAFPVPVVVGQVVIMPGVRVLPGERGLGVPRRVREERRAVRVRGGQRPSRTTDRPGM